METGRRPDRVLVYLAVIFTGVILAAGGCTDTAPQQPGPAGTTGAGQATSPAASAVQTIRTTTIPTAPPAQPSPDPVMPDAAVTFDPIGERTIGSALLISGATSLPAGTNLFWEIRPDTGTLPTGIDLNSRIGIMANNQVISGSGSSNRVSLSVVAKDTKDLPPGKYVVVVVSLKGDPMTTGPSTGTLAGYSSLILK
jgi:hypothetical protein